MATKKFSEAITKQICTYHEHGLNVEDCANLVGVNKTTIYRWLNRGEKAKTGKHKQFYIDFNVARARNKAYHLKKINDSDSWKSSAWLLERMYREEYGRYDKLEVEADVETKVKNVFTVSDEELEEILTIDNNQDEFTDDL